jgi:Tol biopolymer transport system component
VAFTSESTNLGSGHAKGDDIFVYRLGSGAATMLTSAAKAYLPSISGDGQKLVFIAEGYDNDGIGDIYQSSSQGGAKPTIYANCPCRAGGDVAPTWAAIGSGGAMLYSSAAPFSRSNRYIDPQVFIHNPGQRRRRTRRLRVHGRQPDRRRRQRRHGCVRGPDGRRRQRLRVVPDAPGQRLRHR